MIFRVNRLILLEFFIFLTLYSFGNTSVEEIISDYLRRDVMMPVDPKEWLDWALKRYDSCTTKEDFESLTVTALDWVRKQLKDSENNPSVKAGAGDDSEVEVGCDSSVLNDGEIDSLRKNFEASCPPLFALFKDYARDVDRDNFLTSPVDLATGSGSSGVDYNPMCSDLEGCGWDPNGFPNLSKDFICNGSLTLPENLAVGCGSSGEKSNPMCSDDIFGALEDLDL